MPKFKRKKQKTCFSFRLTECTVRIYAGKKNKNISHFTYVGRIDLFLTEKINMVLKKKTKTPLEGLLGKVPLLRGGAGPHPHPALFSFRGRRSSSSLHARPSARPLSQAAGLAHICLCKHTHGPICPRAPEGSSEQELQRRRQPASAAQTLPPLWDEQVGRPPPSEVHQAPVAEANPAVLVLIGPVWQGDVLLRLDPSSSAPAGPEPPGAPRRRPPSPPHPTRKLGP